MQRLLLTAFFLMTFLGSYSQPGKSPLNSTDFIIPDTVCVDEPFQIQNISQGTTTYYWSFCSGDAGTTPLGFVTSTTGAVYSQPVFASLVEDNGKLFSFVTNGGSGAIIRNEYQANLLAPPVSSVNLGTFGVLNNNVRGLQVRKEAGKWYGFVADENLIMRLDFGTSLMNTPTYGLYPSLIDTINQMNGLTMLYDGTQWIGFCTNTLGNSVTRLVWINGLSKTPAALNLGNKGGMNVPWQCAVMKQDTNWYVLVANEGNNTITRLSFGNSLLNTPTGTNLGNVGSLDQNEGILLTRDCEALNGFSLNHSDGFTPLVRLNLPGDISGPVTGVSMGNIGSLDLPATFSELVRLGDTLYTLVTNTGSSSLSLLYFPSCSDASIPSSTLRTPPAISYSTPGEYNITLVTDEGLPTQQNVCKRITVMPPITVNAGNDTLVCSGKLMTLDAGPGFVHYDWSTGDTTQTTQTKKPGTYWVHVTNRWNCEASDTVTISQLPAVFIALDTAICYGATYFIGGAFQSVSGTYFDTLQTADGCDSVRITALTVKDEIPVGLGSDRIICPGETITLHATYSIATYLWQDASTDSTLTVTEPGNYWVHVTYDLCTVGDTVVINECPAELIFPSAFTPNGDGLNDFFRPRGISIAKFHLMIFDRWGQMLFQTDDMERGWDGAAAGVICPAGTYTYTATYEGNDNPGQTKKLKGSFVLVR
ncbi:MAG: gliding motility-associated C-terminal domain-containing protein [Bacteroidetes bacterium]|nr:gliding motility-associated C-terminal domain-containing protein [Bacteroidota bacterium]